RSITVKSDGAYSFLVKDNDECNPKSRAVNVTVYSVPNVTVRPLGAFPLCDVDSVNLDLTAPLGFSSYLWSNGEKTRKIKATKEGEYYYTITTSDGCPAHSDTLKVYIHEPPPKPIITQEGSNLLSSEAYSYQWYLDGNPIEGANSRTFTMLTSGTYKVDVTDNNGCSSASDDFYGTVGVRDIDGFECTIQPNPCTDDFRIIINLSDFSAVDLELVNTTGVTLMKFMLQGDKINKTIDMSAFPIGMYFIKVTINEKSELFKIVKN
ncbi:MAG: hypothetical protein QG635_2349, partial [Bacteroidota bacterium]|nr:hypothetical protein [Bacteroidota bacterium]